MLRQRKLARQRAFIAGELYRTQSCGCSNSGAGLCSGYLSCLVSCRAETAAAARTVPSKETIANTLFLLLSVINQPSCWNGGGMWNKWILIRAFFSQAAVAAVAFLC